MAFELNINFVAPFRGQGQSRVKTHQIFQDRQPEGGIKERHQIEYSNGDFYIGGVFGDEPQGEGKMTYKDDEGQVAEYTGSWASGKRSGWGTMKHRMYEYVGDWQAGHAHGQGQLTLKDGRSYEGAFQNSKAHGEGMAKYADGSSLLAFWHGGNHVDKPLPQEVWYVLQQTPYVSGTRGGVPGACKLRQHILDQLTSALVSPDEAEAALWKIVTDFRQGQLDKMAVFQSRVQVLEATVKEQKDKMKEMSKENLELRRRKNQLDAKIRRLEASQHKLRTELRYAPYAPPPRANAMDEGIFVEATEVVVDNEDGYYSDDQATAVAAMAAPRGTPKRGRPRGSVSRPKKPRYQAKPRILPQVISNPFSAPNVLPGNFELGHERKGPDGSLWQVVTGEEGVQGPSYWEMVLPPSDSSNYAAWYDWYEEGALDTKRNPPPYVEGGPPPLIFQERAPSVRRPRYAPNPNAMTHDQAQAIAESEGLKLMMSNANTTGYLYVHPSGTHFHASVYRAGKKQHVHGSYASAAEAALAMARELGPQGIEASLARNAPDLPCMSVEEVAAAVQAEGLTLLRDDSPTGFLGVGPVLRATAKSRFRADIGPHGDKKYLGVFATAEEAALAYARALGPEGVEAYLNTASSEAPPMTKEQVDAAVASEGLALVRANNKTGYKNVTKTSSHSKPFKMTMRHKHTHFHLGVYATLEEAALAYARAVGTEQSREEAAAYEQKHGFFSTGTRHPEPQQLCQFDNCLSYKQTGTFCKAHHRIVQDICRDANCAFNPAIAPPSVVDKHLTVDKCAAKPSGGA